MVRPRSRDAKDDVLADSPARASRSRRVENEFAFHGPTRFKVFAFEGEQLSGGQIVRRTLARLRGEALEREDDLRDAVASATPVPTSDGDSRAVQTHDIVDVNALYRALRPIVSSAHFPRLAHVLLHAPLLAGVGGAPDKATRDKASEFRDARGL